MPLPHGDRPRDRMRWLALRVLGNAAAVLSVYPNLEYTKLEEVAANDLLDLLDALEAKEAKRIADGGFVYD
jgi:hypothetical protein